MKDIGKSISDIYIIVVKDTALLRHIVYVQNQTYILTLLIASLVV